MKPVRKIISAVSMSLVILLLVQEAAPSVVIGAQAPYITVEEVPAIDQGSVVTGYVRLPSGQINYGDYAITMALEVTRGEAVWAPKPTHAQSAVSLDQQGYFSCRFNTGGMDTQAERLYVCLIPASFKPDSDFEATRQKALDVVVIDRDPDGAVRIDQRMSEPTTLPAETTHPVVSASPSASAILPQQKNPRDNTKLSLCFSPYTNGISPESNDSVPMEQIAWLMNLIYPYADTIRLFGVTGELYKAYQPAKEEYGFRVIGGCWLDPAYSPAQIQKELDTLIQLANDGLVDIAVVGSECLYRGEFTAAQLIEWMSYVRKGIRDDGIPVTTSDTFAAYMSHPELFEAVDAVLFTYYPFFEKAPVAEGAAMVKNAYQNLKARAGGKAVILSESGWPSAGSPEGAAIPSEENAARYFEELYNLSRAENFEAVGFCAVDEDWKREGSNQDVGGHWGFFTSAGELKVAYRPLFHRIAPFPVADADGAKWAEKEILELVKAGKISAAGPSLFDPGLPIKRGEFMHYLVGAVGLKNAPKGVAFSDVSPNLYYYDSLSIGRQAELISGVGENLCQPEGYVTRQDLFVLIYRAMKQQGAAPSPDEGLLAAFSDRNTISGYAREGISALVKAGIVSGDGGRIRPQDNATRAEAAMLLYKVLQN